MLKKQFTFLLTFFVATCSFQELPPEDQWKNHAVKIFQAFKADLTAESSLEEMNAFAQSNFLRPRGQERSSPETIAHYKELVGPLTLEEKVVVYKAFDALGDLKDVLPQNRKPDYILIMGSTAPSLRSRIMFLNRLVKEGHIVLQPTVRVVFLSGDRPLFPSETPEVLMSSAPYEQQGEWVVPETLPQNEMDLPPFLWEQLKLTPPLSALEPLYVNAPKKDGAKRATTADTVEAFAHKYTPKTGHVLVISENPFVTYQGLVTKMLFLQKGLKGFTFEAVGAIHRAKERPFYIRLGVLLDNFARALYQRVALKKVEGTSNNLKT